MCKKGELIWMPNLGPYGRYIDRCMGPTITLLNELGIQTLACCCGHGRYPKTIVIVYPIRNVPVERYTNIPLLTKDGIPRKLFYKKDED